MNNKIIFILGSSLLTLISCGNKPYINKTLEYDGEYYSFRVEGKISKGTRYRFTATEDDTHQVTYFGMSKYEGNTPYFDLGINDSSKLVNITSVYKKDGNNKTLLKYGTDYSYYSPTYYKILLLSNNELIAIGNEIIIECTINSNLSSGLWAYIGSYKLS